ncbi:hypothetical protein [Hymenobacter sp. HDW8]|uniref:hypothetical protein n=1 Tax=Hymenobacter sp. HDW8 TaxID=2714932 RepID=UPI00140C9BFF|nr:hypothetical protein [Hymenobacter sp. HDW8]QIL76402.1 hypothetical protein G7064_11405 [Hymenobacter sp. HDW8]
MRQQLIPLESRAHWEETLQDISYDFAHSWHSCYAMHLTTGLDTYLYCFQDEDVKIVCPISERTFEGYVDIVTPYGFSGFIGNKAFPEFQRYWKDFAKGRGYICGFISINPVISNQTYLENSDVYSYNSLYILDLRLSIEDLFSNLDRNRRRQLKNWEQIAPQFITDKSILIDFFLENYHAFFQQKNASSGYLFSLETLSYIVNLDNVLLVGFGDSKIEAVSVFAYTPHGAQALFHISLPEGRNHTMPLLWYAIQYLKSVNIPFLNMGGGLQDGDSIADFKQRCGAQKMPLSCLKQVYNADIYSILCKSVNADPNNKVGYFPPYHFI